jgi:hypothetical protein
MVSCVAFKLKLATPFAFVLTAGVSCDPVILAVKSRLLPRFPAKQFKEAVKASPHIAVLVVVFMFQVLG